MGMNPDTNEFEMFLDGDEMKRFTKRFYGQEPEESIPIFRLGEELVIRGYVFEVRQINKNQLVLRPVRKADGPFPASQDQ